MSDKLHLSLTVIAVLASVLAMLAAWTPIVLKLCTPCKIQGKIISRYKNLNKGRSQTYFIYKISVLCQNKSFNLRIYCNRP